VLWRPWQSRPPILGSIIQKIGRAGQQDAAMMMQLLQKAVEKFFGQKASLALAMIASQAFPMARQWALALSIESF